MAAAPCCHGSWLLPQLLLLLAAGTGALGAAEGASPVLVQLDVESLLPSTAAASCPTAQPQEQRHGAATATRMPIVHQHGPCSPLADKHGNAAPSHAEVLVADQRRVEYIHRRVSKTTGRARRKHNSAPVDLKPGTPSSLSSSVTSSTSGTSLPVSSGEALDTGSYVVPIRLGTPAERFTVVFDTGSDTTWVQCQPCVFSCYKQKEPLFTPTKSATYANISCTSSYCSDLDSSGCSSSGGHCMYAVQYGDGSYTVGFYGQDTLTLGNDTIKDFRFGCGEWNRGLFGKAAGLMGLGRGNTSLPVQAYNKYSGVFSYCIPATSSGTGFLDFGPGAAAAAAAANTRVTPMLVDNGTTFYYVGMTGIKVGGHLLPIPRSVFSDAGAMFDSGTVITRLPPSAYEALRSAFDGAMEDLGYEKAPAFSILDTCYNLTGYLQGGGSIALPAVSLVFRGRASLDVDASGILYVADVSQACLAFAANDNDTDVAIVGNTQQQTYSVFHDLDKKVVGFAPGAC